MYENMGFDGVWQRGCALRCAPTSATANGVPAPGSLGSAADPGGVVVVSAGAEWQATGGVVSLNDRLNWSFCYYIVCASK
jgi:hypothetical protein